MRTQRAPTPSTVSAGTSSAIVSASCSTNSRSPTAGAPRAILCRQLLKSSTAGLHGTSETRYSSAIWPSRWRRGLPLSRPRPAARRIRICHLSSSMANSKSKQQQQQQNFGEFSLLHILHTRVDVNQRKRSGERRRRYISMEHGQ